MGCGAELRGGREGAWQKAKAPLGATDPDSETQNWGF